MVEGILDGLRWLGPIGTKVRKSAAHAGRRSGRSIDIAPWRRGWWRTVTRALLLAEAEGKREAGNLGRWLEATAPAAG
jgi:hypothetical protein